MDSKQSAPGAAPDESSLIDKLKRRFVYGLVFGIAVVAAITLLGDGPALLHTLARFEWDLLPLIVLLTLGNYLLRFLKWQLFLRWLDIGPIERRTSFGIFLSGLSMAITPGKVGEFLKSYLLRRVTGTPVSVSAPIILAERVSDGLAMLLLAAIGLAAVHYGWPLLVALAIIAAICLTLLRQRALMFRLFERLERIRLLSRRMHQLHALYESTYLLFQPRNLLGATAIGVVSWWGECVAFFLILLGLGFPASVHLLLTATFILATATLIGTISLLPGGLGAADASVAGLLLLLVKNSQGIQGRLMNHDLAAAATLLIRFCTLWFGVLLGLVALLLIERHIERVEARARSAAVDAAQAAD